MVKKKKSDPPGAGVGDETPTLLEEELGDTGMGAQMVNVFYEPCNGNWVKGGGRFLVSMSPVF